MIKTYPAGMTAHEFARWVSLTEAIDLIAEKCEELGIDFYGDEGLEYIKPLTIQRYIDERTDQLTGKLTRSQKLESQRYMSPIVHDEV
jgi:hypothetical protein